MGVAINVPELFYILNNTPSDQCIMLAGKHGIGKSEILTDFYTRQGMHVEPFFLGQMSDPGDLIGLPDKDRETNKTINMLPYWFPTDGKPIVLFLDELNRARPELLQVIQDLVLNKKIVGRRLPEGSIIVSAVNEGDSYTLTELDPALKSRFNIYTFVPEVTDWIKWATEKGVSEHVISYIVSHSDMLDCKLNSQVDGLEKDVDRRAWNKVSDNIKLMESRGSFIVDNNFKKMLCGIVGSVAGIGFYEFIKKQYGIFPIDLLSNFNAIKPKLNGFGIIEYMNLCSSLCGYINMTDPRTDKHTSDMFSANLILFFNHLISIGKKEIVAYFTSNYESMMYPRMNMFIASNEDMDNYINKFISNIEI